ncbi:sigma-54 interaction domain-containing protein [Alteribacillus iranensis]|uniref:Arginine utilization regulatory protein n=1 Tax=Alteribacillus iranensis TaxID=930128 RepID=A0A1I2BJZ1_9BACI|nr:sigma 54-interacting transcriptional regulator [Alteribacillus iranensis]SFE56237.1 arginine utilization regulatory protein [Alteribacillus iranensis]
MNNTNKMLHAILRTIDEGIHAVDADGITIYYNHVAAKLDGLEQEEVLGKHLLTNFPSLTIETSTLMKVCQTGEAIYNQHQTYQNSRGVLVDTVNTTLPIKENGKLIGAVEVAKDVTKVKHLSEKLLDLQAKIEKGKTNRSNTNDTTGAVFHMRDIITKNEAFQELKKKAEKVAATTSPILIYGETGTGKELLVQAIHNASPRKTKPFVAQNCAAIPSSLLESTLFGTVKGSYTGAIDRPGLFELADGGTLFLDELSSMPLDIQAKLLRVLQNGLIRRVGGTKEFPVNVRIIAALNEEPEICVEKEKLRSDLYYRLNVIYLPIPELRERRDDIPVLIDHFIQKYNYQFETLVTRVDPAVKEIFHSYHWPGNVRELEHAIESAMNLVEGDTITTEHLPQHIIDTMSSSSQASPETFPPLREAVLDTEKRLIQEALQETNGNVQRAAKLLRIPRQTLQYKMNKLNVH